MTSYNKRVNVTADDIAKSERKDSSSCIVATAVARTIPTAVRIMVDTQLIRFTDGATGKRHAFLTPGSVMGYIVAFDAGDHIQPFSFQLRNAVQIRQKKLTEAGRTLHNESIKRTKRRQKLLAAGLPIPEELQPRPRRRQSPRGKGLSDNSANQPGVIAAPTVFKRKERTFGMRLLRINQEMHGRNDARIVPPAED